MSKSPVWLAPEGGEFPDPATALADPNGLLAIGGNLHPSSLIRAYRSGIFPWYEDPQPILWWSPNPRAVLVPGELHVSRSLRRTLRSGRFRVTFDHRFAQVIDSCARLRRHRDGTWITDRMAEAFNCLHALGYAHSVEVFHGDRLQGGLYGMALGRVFFGESMFSLQADASKVAFYALNHILKHWDFRLIDCQVDSEHLRSMGAITLPREHFLEQLRQFAHEPDTVGPWQVPADLPDLATLQ